MGVAAEFSPIVFTAALAGALLAERLFHAVAILLVYLVRGSVLLSPDTKVEASQGLLGRAVDLGVEILRNLAGALGGLLQWVIYYVPFVLICCLVLFVLNEAQVDSSVQVGLLRAWNDRGIGVKLRALLLTPVQALELVTGFLVPVWNAVIFFWKGMLTYVLLPAIQVNADTVLQGATAMGRLVQILSESALRYTDTFKACSDAACLAPGVRLFDFLTPLLQLRVVVAFLLRLARDTCVVGTPVFDVMATPLLDANFAQALHLALNVPLYAAVQLPLVTHARCLQAVGFGDERLRALACTPDVAPVFNLVAASARHSGQVLDNWLDVAWVSLLTVFGDGPPRCDNTLLTLRDFTQDETFDGNEVRLVGLGATVYAMTDGKTTQFTFHRGAEETVLARDHWPLYIEPGLGIAAIQFDEDEQVDEGGQRTLSMLGCRCVDVEDAGAVQGTRMELQCAIARYQAEDADEALDANGLYVPVGFALPSTAQYMTCAGTKITVDSVRWPVSRLSVPGSLGAGGRSFTSPLSEFAREDGEDGPVEVDATIFVQPACSAEGDFDAVCNRNFKEAACFPFCVAARRRGSGAQGLTLYSSDDWQSRVQLQRRDCGVARVSASLDTGEEYVGAGDTAALGAGKVVVSDRLDPLGRVLTLQEGASTASSTCVASDTVTTRVPRSAEQVQSADLDARFSFVLLEGQPFAVAGSVALTEGVAADGSPTVRVQRLFGEYGTESFSLVTTRAALPAIAPCKTLSGCDQLPRDDLVSIPYAWSTAPGRHNPAVETRWGVFYAVNPSLDMFSEFSKYCQGRTDYNLQIQALSSYGGIRIWRLDAFAVDEGQAASAKQLEFPEVFLSQTNDTSICGSAFNVMVTSMEYLSEENVAVTVLHAAPAYLDARTKKPLGNDPQRVRYRTYFLHPQTMALREDRLWQADSGTTQLEAGASSLCPDWRNMPQVGSLLGELLAGSALATRMFVGLGLAGPAVLRDNALGALRSCPAVHLGHSLLLDCGRSLFSLDASFTALRKANAHMWMSLVKLGRLLRGMPGGGRVHSFMQGLAMVKQHTFWSLMRRRDFSRQMEAVARPGDFVQGRVNDFAMKQYQRLTEQVQALPARLQDLRQQVSVEAARYAKEQMEAAKQFWQNPSLSTMQTMGAGIDGVLFAPPDRQLMMRMPGFNTGQRAMGQSALGMAQFFWRLMVRLLQKLLERDAQEPEPLAPVLWQSFTESKEDFDQFLVLPAMRACSGLGLMLGYSNPWARLARESCTTAVAMQASLRESVEAFFVMTPVLTCLCRDPAGRPFDEYARDVCWRGAPEHMRPMIAALVSRRLGQAAVCEEVSTTVEDQLRAVLDPSMEHAFKATEAVAGFIDYATVLFDPDAGRCSELLSSPYTMALIPEPFDYFAGCRKTRTCRSKCLEVFEQFESIRARLADDGDVQSVQQTVETRFFSTQTVLEGRAAPPFEVLALAELDVMDESAVSGRACCNGVDERDRCVAVAGVNASRFVEVVEYCVPRRAGVGVHEHVRWAVERSDEWAFDMMSLAFVGTNHGRREMLVARMEREVRLVRRDGEMTTLLEVLPLGAAVLSGRADMHTIAYVFVAPDNFVLIHGFIEQEGRALGERRSALVRLDRFAAWPSQYYAEYAITDLPVHLTGHTATCMGDEAGDRCAAFLMMPTSPDKDVLRCTPQTPASLARSKYSCVQAAPSRALSGALGLYTSSGAGVQVLQSSAVGRRSVRVAQNTRAVRSGVQRTIFVSSPLATSASWLQEVRLSWDEQVGSSASVERVGSQQMPMTVKVHRGCSLDDCTGCRNPSVQRACFSAQQCGLAKCVGTVVNLERPLCTVGSLVQAGLEVNLVKFHGIWLVLSDIVIFFLRAATGRWMTGKELETLDEVFFALICEAKDAIVASMSVLTALVNSLMNTASRAKAEQRYRPTLAEQNEAANSEAVRALAAAANTNLLAQLALGVLYIPIVTKKVVFCHSTGFLNVLAEAGGVTLSLQAAQFANATAAVTGKCLSEYQKDAMQSPGDANSQRSFSEISRELVYDGIEKVLGSYFEWPLHTLDAAFAYLQGVLTGVMDVTATFDQAHCNLPDHEMEDTPKCACGDEPLKIPASRGAQGVADGALWCQGVLALTGSDGKPRLVLNPYTYNELVGALASGDAYLQCISRREANCVYLRPTLEKLQQQGVSLFTAAVRCKANFANSVWDEGAAALFADAVPKDLIGVSDEFVAMRGSATGPGALSPALVACMQQSLSEGTENDACLQLFLTERNERSLSHFEYEDLDPGVGTEHIAACKVFSGPAANGFTQFQACLDDTDASGCTLPPMVWAGRSTNRVPVASEHSVRVREVQDRVEEARQRHFVLSQELTEFLNSDALRNWEPDDLELALFTAEGDSLHQLFDALVLGPFARADLWPRDADGVLPALEYFRDAAGGSTRDFELPCTGAALRNKTSTPYTCGSDARRAAIRFFVRDVFFGKNEQALKEGVRRAVHEQLDKLRAAWLTDVSTYGCACADGAGQSPACCVSGDTASFLPGSLQAVTYTTVHGESLVRELFRMVSDFVQKGLFSRAAEPLVKHSSDGALWGVEEREQAAVLGLFQGHREVLAYDATEVAAPLGWHHAEGTGNVSLWEHCNGVLHQSLATLPVLASGALRGGDALPVFDPLVRGAGYVSALEDFVEKATRESLLRSPLYYSHVMRHLPSDSLVCEQDAGHVLDENTGTAQILRSEVDGVDVLGRDVPLPGLAWIDRHAGALGGARFACLCGWADENGCYLPREVCEGATWGATPGGEDVSRACGEMADAPRAPVPRPGLSLEGDAVRDVVIAFWDDTWECASMQPSASWGVYNSTATAGWLAGDDAARHGAPTTQEILLRGRAGLRVGNLDRLLNTDEWRTLISPGAQKTQPVSADASVGQRWCAANVHGMLNASSLADAFVDELFPMAQSVMEATPLAVCLRMVVEGARLRTLRVLNLHAGNLDEDVARWRRECLQQMDTLALCTLRGVFDAPPVNEKAPACPFSVDAAGNSWLTPGCLLRAEDGRFFDPCNCHACAGEAIRAQDVVENCRPLFDPRSLFAGARATASLHWARSFAHVPEERRGALEAAAAAVQEAKQRPQVGAVVEKLLHDHAEAWSTTFGNSGGRWFSAEGAAGESTSFCDAIHDWWPEEFAHPVGVHPTAPCGADETRYRGFASGFTIKKRGATDAPKMVFQHDALANRTVASQRFGLAGVCRTRTFAQPQQDLNNMRFCTRVDPNARADPAFPHKGSRGVDAADSLLEACADSAEAVPWDGWQTAGLLLGWPETGDDGEMMVWPGATLGSRPFQPNASFAGTGWGEGGCGLPALRMCTDHSDCETDELKAANIKTRCIGILQGARVCAVDRQHGSQLMCTKHGDCTDGWMCSGDALCVKPIIVVENNLPETVLAHLHAETCADGEAVDFYGRSPWEQIPDVLRAHGLCSHRRWFEYRDLLNRASDLGWECTYSGGEVGGECVLKVDEISRAQTSIFGDYDENKPSLRQQGMMKMTPHTCDRSFMHMPGFSECLPGSGDNPRKVLRWDGQRRGLGDDAFGTTFSTYRRRVNDTLRVAKLPFFDNAQVGFLGTGKPLQEEDGDGNRRDVLQPVSCAEIAQCSLQQFSVRGMFVRNRVAKNVVGFPNFFVRQYKVRDSVSCGAYGVMTKTTTDFTEKCRLDRDVVPMYWMLCEGHATTLENSHCKLNFDSVQGRESLCEDVRKNWSPTEAGRNAKRKQVNELLNGIKAWSKNDLTIESYFDQLSCAKQFIELLNTERGQEYDITNEDGFVVQKISSVGLYFFTDFALYEIAPLWFVRCKLFSDIDVSDAQGAVSCAAWEESRTITEDAATWLARHAGDFNSVDLQVAKSTLASNMTFELQKMLSMEAAKHKISVDEVFQPWCYNTIQLNMDRIRSEKQQSSGNQPFLRVLRSLCDGLEDCTNLLANENFKATNPLVCSNENECVVRRDRRMATSEEGGLFKRLSSELVNPNYFDVLSLDKVVVSDNHLYLFDIKSLGTNSIFQQIKNDVSQDYDGECVKAVENEDRVCLYDSADRDVNSGYSDWLNFGLQHMYVRLSSGYGYDDDVVGVVGGPPWVAEEDTTGRLDKKWVQFDICEKSAAGGYSDFVMERGCGILAKESMTCTGPSISQMGTDSMSSDGAPRAFKGAVLDQTLCHDDANAPTRCYDANDPCFVPGSSAKRKFAAEATALDQQPHDMQRFTGAMLPVGVTLKLITRPSNAEVNIREQVIPRIKVEEIQKTTTRADGTVRPYKVGYYPHAYRLKNDFFNAVIKDDSEFQEDVGFYVLGREAEERANYGYYLKGQMYGGAAWVVHSELGKENAKRCIAQPSWDDIGEEFCFYSSSVWMNTWPLKGITTVDGTQQILRSHTPRILSDAFEQVPRDSKNVVHARLKAHPGGSYSGSKRAQPIFRGHGKSAEPSLEALQTLLYEPFAEPEYKLSVHVDVPDDYDKFGGRRILGKVDEYGRYFKRFESDNQYDGVDGTTTVFKAKTFTRRGATASSPISHVQFESTQAKGDGFDENYPSALHVGDENLFMSFGALRHLLATHVGCNNAWTGFDGDEPGHCMYEFWEPTVGESEQVLGNFDKELQKGQTDFCKSNTSPKNFLYSMGEHLRSTHYAFIYNLVTFVSRLLYPGKFGTTGSWQKRHNSADCALRAQHFTVQRRTFSRKVGSLGKTLEDMPDRLHCAATGKLRTLQDIVEAPMDNLEHQNHPWKLLDKDFNDFRETIRSNMPTVYMRYFHYQNDGDARLARWDTEDSDARSEGPNFLLTRKQQFSDNSIDDVESLQTDWGRWGFETETHLSAQSLTDTARVRTESDEIVDKYIEEYPGEAKLLYIMVQWDKIRSKWFEVYRADTVEVLYEGKKTLRGKEEYNTFTTLDRHHIVAYELSVGEVKEHGGTPTGSTLHCVDNPWGRTETSTLTLEKCGKGQIGALVARNVLRCGPCFTLQKDLCSGPHLCGAPDWYSGDSAITDQDDVDVFINFALQKMREAVQSREFWVNSNNAGRAVLPAQGYKDLVAGGDNDTPITWDAFDSSGFNVLPVKVYEKSTGVYDPQTRTFITSPCQEESSQSKNQVDYTKCDMDSGLRHLNKTVHELYTERRGVRVPSNSKAAWEISFAQWGGRGMLPWWEVEERDRRDRFSTWLLDTDAHCASHDADRLHSVCFVNEADMIRVFNPWVGGDFSPLDRCDNTYQEGLGGRVLDTRCRKTESVCKDEDDSEFNREQYQGLANDNYCWDRNGDKTRNRVVRESQRSNLCTARPRENSTCLHKYGTLAGKGVPVGDLYEPASDADELQMRTDEGVGAVGVSGRGGLFVSPRHLAWHGNTYPTGIGEAGVLRMDDDDIGGHQVRFKIDSLGLHVSDVHMGLHRGLRDAVEGNWQGRGTDWLNYDEVGEAATVERELLAPDRAEDWTDWACPLRQQHFLTGHDAGFAPRLPDLRRARIIFSEANDNQAWHPAQKAGSADPAPTGLYFSPNGVCLCGRGVDCRDVATTGQGVCSFMGTVQGLRSGEWGTSEVRDEGCMDQIDWPFAGGSLRDGATLQRSQQDRCGTLDRLPTYEFRWAMVDWEKSGTGAATTLDEGGVCHTARLAETDDDATETLARGGGEECVLTHRNATALVLLCGEHKEVLVLPRTARQAPADVLAAVRGLRRRCSQCAPAPVFETHDGRPLEPESSVGRPFRISTARKVAAELRRELVAVLCGGSVHASVGCKKLDDALNHSAWAPEEFWGHLLGDPRGLLAADALESLNASSGAPAPLKETLLSEGDVLGAAQDATGEDALWEEPWLYCKYPSPQCSEVCEPATGVCEERCENQLEEMQCRGTVPRETWVDPTKRFPAVVEAFTAAALQQGKLVQELNICDLDSTLNSLCTRIAAARSRVFDANCFAAGDCFQTKFAYQPSVFSLSNNEFVRTTVRSFYHFLDSDACAVEDSESSERLREQNALLVQKCPATTLGEFQKVLSVARATVGAIIRASYFLSMIVLNIVQLMIPTSLPGEPGASARDGVHTAIATYWELFVNELGDVFAAWGELLFKAVFGSGPGQFMQEMVQWVCELVEFLWNIVYHGIACPVAYAALSVIDGISWFFTDLKEVADQFRATLANSCQSDDESGMCSYVAETFESPIARIDTATRCWASYVNGLGDASSLSCSAADSCMYDGGSSLAVGQSRLVACDDCPFTAAPDFQRFGCNIVTKQCSCGVQTLTRSSCINHAQCAIDTATTCDLLDTSFEPVAFGTTPCVDCVAAQPACLDAPGGARCACVLRETQYQGCAATDVGKTVMLDAGKLCLVALDTSLADKLRRSSEFVVGFSELAAVPCALVDIASVFCMAVHYSADEGVPLAVALNTMVSGRRLLEAPEDEALRAAVLGEPRVSAVDLAAAEKAPWDAVHSELCRALLLPDAQPVGETDRLNRRQCVRWRAVGAGVARAYNLSVPDTFLLSAADLADSMQHYHLLRALVRHPQIVLYVALHSEYAAPVRACMRWARRYAHYLTGSLRDLALWRQRAGTLHTAVEPGNATVAGGVFDEFVAASLKAWPVRLTNESAPPAAAPNASASNSSGTAHRALLSFDASVAAVETYSTKVALGDGATQILGVSSEVFSEAPIEFPPLSVQWDSDLSCMLVDALGEVASTTANLLSRFFSEDRPQRGNASSLFVTPFQDALKSPDERPVESENPFLMRAALYVATDVLRVPRGLVRHWLSMVPDIMYDLLVCDIDAVMFCSRLRYSLLTGGVFVGVAMFIVALALSSVGVPYVWTLVGISYLPLVLFFCMGISPRCFPMVPTCLGDEVILMIDTAIPSKLVLPIALQTVPGCIDDANVTASTCVKSCGAYPFEFTDWDRPLAWGLCETGVCANVQRALEDFPFTAPGEFLYPFKAALWRSQLILSNADPDVVAAHRWCALTNSWRIFPLLIVVGALCYVIPVLLMLPLQIVLSAVQLALTALPLAHRRTRG